MVAGSAFFIAWNIQRSQFCQKFLQTNFLNEPQLCRIVLFINIIHL